MHERHSPGSDAHTGEVEARNYLLALRRSQERLKKETLSQFPGAYRRGGSENDVGRSPGPQALPEKMEVKHIPPAHRRSKERCKKETGDHRRGGSERDLRRFPGSQALTGEVEVRGRTRPSSTHRRRGSKRLSPGPQALTGDVEERGTLPALRRSRERWK